MGIGGISIWQLLIVLAIVVMLFGTKRLRNIGSDLGEAIKGFRNSISDKEGDSDPFEQNNDNVIDGKAEELKENGK
ncbi:MAG: Sec-independent protein translocase subunit TatA [Pseudomonadales bacterium]